MLSRIAGRKVRSWSKSSESKSRNTSNIAFDFDRSFLQSTMDCRGQCDKKNRENGDECGMMIETTTVSVGTQTEIKIREENRTADTMWNIIEKGIGQKIPVYLKNIMHLEGYDIPIAIQSMSEEHIKDLEYFGSTQMLNFIKESDEHSDYFDKYYICPNEFRISTGHKILLSEIQKFVAEKLSTDKMYFTSELRPEELNCQSRKCTKSTNTNHKETVCSVNQAASELENEYSSLNSSQYAKSGSNPITPVDINLNAEHDGLYILILAWLKKQSKIYKNVEKQIIDRFSPASVEMAIIENVDGSESRDAKIRANVMCPLCQAKIKVHKFEHGKYGTMKWVKSSFDRHMRLHFSIENCSHSTQMHGTKGSTGKTKQVSLETCILQSFPKKQVKDELINKVQEEQSNSQDTNNSVIIVNNELGQIQHLGGHH